MSRKTKQSAILPNRMQKKSLSHLDSSSSLHSWIRQFSLIHANCISPSCNTLLSLPPFACFVYAAHKTETAALSALSKDTDKSVLI